MIQSAQYSVSTSPVQIYAGGGAATILIHSETVVSYLGGSSSVSSTTGYKLDINDKINLSVHEDPIWAVTASLTAPVTVLVVTK
jgi:hypothetical protein